MAGKLPRRAEQFRRPGGEGKALALGERLRAGLAAALDQLRLVVIEIQVRRRAGQVKVDHLASLGGKMRLPEGERVNDVLGRGSAFACGQRRQGQRAES